LTFFVYPAGIFLEQLKRPDIMCKEIPDIIIEVGTNKGGDGKTTAIAIHRRTLGPLKRKTYQPHLLKFKKGREL
jgi:hypothetical protein